MEIFFHELKHCILKYSRKMIEICLVNEESFCVVTKQFLHKSQNSASILWNIYGIWHISENHWNLNIVVLLGTLPRNTCHIQEFEQETFL